MFKSLFLRVLTLKIAVVSSTFRLVNSVRLQEKDTTAKSNKCFRCCPRSGNKMGTINTMDETVNLKDYTVQHKHKTQDQLDRPKAICSFKGSGHFW